MAARYLGLRDWKLARAQVRSENLLQVRTAAAATRIGKELTARLEVLDVAELQCLIDGSVRERGYLLWAAACRRYPLIRDFAVEVLVQHYLSLRHRLTLMDYEAFYGGKATWHAELDELAPSTQRKLRQNLFRMMRDADLLSVQSLIQPTMLTPRVAQLLARQGRQALQIFPTTESEISRWLK